MSAFSPISDEALAEIREKLNAAEPDCYLTMKRGLYERPEHRGYTGVKEHAGRWSKEEAEAYTTSDVSMCHWRDAPEFTDACFDDLARAHLREKLVYANATARSLIARLDAAEAEVADLKESVIAFAAPAAVGYAQAFGLAGLHPQHFDLLKRCGARMVDFKRAPPHQGPSA